MDEDHDWAEACEEADENFKRQMVSLATRFTKVMLILVVLRHAVWLAYELLRWLFNSSFLQVSDVFSGIPLAALPTCLLIAAGMEYTLIWRLLHRPIQGIWLWLAEHVMELKRQRTNGSGW